MKIDKLPFSRRHSSSRNVIVILHHRISCRNCKCHQTKKKEVSKEKYSVDSTPQSIKRNKLATRTDLKLQASLHLWICTIFDSFD